MDMIAIIDTANGRPNLSKIKEWQNCIRGNALVRLVYAAHEFYRKKGERENN